MGGVLPLKRVFVFLAMLALMVLVTYPGVAAGRAVTGELITSAQDAASYAARELAGLDHEEVRVIFLDGEGRILKVARVTQGYAGEVYFVPWEIVVKQVPEGTKTVYVVHNHPRGVLALSRGDIAVGSFWVHRARGIGIYLDLLAIVPDGRYVSLQEEGLVVAEPTGLQKSKEYLDFVVGPGFSMAITNMKRVIGGDKRN